MFPVSKPSAELKALRALRDELIAWFVEMAEPQVRQGIRYMNPKASKREVADLAKKRAEGFFAGLICSFDNPNKAGLREVKQRMDRYLRVTGPLATRKVADDARWAEKLAG